MLPPGMMARDMGKDGCQTLSDERRAWARGGVMKPNDRRGLKMLVLVVALLTST